MVHINGMESFWSLLKRGYYGIYHKASPNHLQRYVDEFVGRRNTGHLDIVTQVERTAKGFVGKTLEDKDLVAPRKRFA